MISERHNNFYHEECINLVPKSAEKILIIGGGDCGISSKLLKRKKVKIILYEPYVNEKYFDDIEVVSDLHSFLSRSDLIIANRLSDDLSNVLDKVYSRDIFQEN